MGKAKSSVSSKNDRGPKKTYHLQAEEKPVMSKITKKSKLSNKTEANEFNVDSLECLRNSPRKKKLNGIDEKIKLLKTELKTLLSGKTLDKISDYSTDTVYNSRSSNVKNVYNFNQQKPIVLESNCIKLIENDENFSNSQNIKPVSASTPFKFSEQPKEAVQTEIFVETVEKKLSDARNLYINSKSCVDKATEANSKIFNVHSFSQEKVEQLLYESFVIQNSELCLPHFEVNDSENRKSTIKTKNKKFRSTKQCQVYNTKFAQVNSNKYCRSTRRGRKRRMININSSLNKIEVVNLDSSSGSNLEARNDANCEDLDIKDYDWNEPFDLHDTEFPSKLKSLESYETRGIDENQESKLNNIDLKETKINCNDENEKTILKGSWECPVCFEQSKGQEVVATQCGHIFCKKCLENHYLKLSKNCPSCRANLKNKPYITLFNF